MASRLELLIKEALPLSEQSSKEDAFDTVLLNVNHVDEDEDARFTASSRFMTYIYQQFTVQTLVKKAKPTIKALPASLTGKKMKSPAVASEKLTIVRRYNHKNRLFILQLIKTVIPLL